MITSGQRKMLNEIETYLSGSGIEFETSKFSEDEEGVPCIMVYTDNMNQYNVAELQDIVYKDLPDCIGDIQDGDRGFYSKVVLLFNPEDIPGSLNESIGSDDIYLFNIQWNTGDYEWDNIPDEEDFEGTIQEVKEYLEDVAKAPSNFEEELLAGEKVYDEETDTWSVRISK